MARLVPSSNSPSSADRRLPGFSEHSSSPRQSGGKMRATFKGHVTIIIYLGRNYGPGGLKAALTVNRVGWIFVGIGV